MNTYILKALEDKEKVLVNKKNALYIEADSIDKELKKCTKLREYVAEPSKFLDMTPKEAVAFFKTCGIEDEKEIKSTYVRLIHQAMQVGFDIDKDDEPINLRDKKEEIDTVVDDLERITYNIFPEEYNKYIDRLLAEKKEKQNELQSQIKKEMVDLLSKKAAQGGVIYKINNIEVPIFIVKDRIDKMFRGDATIEDIIPITTIAICYDSDRGITKQDVKAVEDFIGGLDK